MTLTAHGYRCLYALILTFLLIQLSIINAQNLICPLDVDVGNDAGHCGAIVSYPDPDVIHPFGNLELVSGLASGSFFDVGTTTQVYTAADGSGNVISCSFNVTVNDLSTDSDCDGVGDDCDVCPGGDDRVDNNGDGFPDCAVFPGFAHVIRDWVCSSWKKKNKHKKKKYLICHRRNNRRSHTLCVSKSAVRAHLRHGDFLGPCTSCGHHRDAAREDSEEQEASLTIYPNPAHDIVHVEVQGLEEGGIELEILDLSGQIVLQEAYASHASEMTIELALDERFTDGLFIVRVTQNDKLLTKSLIVMRH